MIENIATIKLAAEHNKLKLVKNLDATTQSVNTIQIAFSFLTDEWKTMNKIVMFFRKDITPIAVTMNTDNSCVIPWEILNVPSTWHGEIVYDVGIIGTGTNSSRLTTNKIRLKIQPGCYAQGQSSQTPTPTIYDQLSARIDALNDYSETEIKAFIAEYCDDNDIATEDYVDTHANNTTKHITQTERQTWNAKADTSDIPTKVSELTNDSGYLTQHQSLDNYATKTYVDTNGGKIDKIKVNGTEQTITNKTVDIAVPTKTSDITNDSGFLTSYQPLKTINNQSIAGTGNITINTENNAYNNIKQIADYLFEVQYSGKNINYTYANEYFKSKPPANSIGGGACTGIVKDGKVLRQLDWYYDNNAEFIVRTVANPEDEIHASIGIASGIKGLTKDVVESGTYNNKFNILPFIMTDGINDAGLYIQSNVVQPLPNGFNLNPTGTTECCVTMASRYILDHCASLNDVHSFFNTVHIYGTSAITYGYHFLIAKGNQWEVIELTSNGYVIVSQGTETNQMPHGIMTNFRTTGLIFTEDDIDWNSIEEYGIGVERYEVATKAFTESATLESLRSSLKYSNLYTDENRAWKTEYSGYMYNNVPLKVMDAKNNPDWFNDIFVENNANFEIRSRTEENPTTWQTVHSAIYDLSNKSFNVAIQERMNETFDFSLIEVKGTYSKPQGGIPKTDLSSSIQSSLDKADSAIQDISGKVDKVQGKGLSTEDYTTVEKTKLAGIATGAEVNVQSDWNQASTTADDYIKNKPSIATDEEIVALLAEYTDVTFIMDGNNFVIDENNNLFIK